MNPPIGPLTPIKAALGRWLVDFHRQFSPETDATVEWAGRATAKAMSFVPGRMADAADEMLSSWRNNDNSGAAGTSALLPAVLIAVANEYTETPGDDGRPLTDYMPIRFPDDTRRRSFRVRTRAVDLRAQFAVFAGEIQSCSSIIGQLLHWRAERQRFKAPFAFKGFVTEWPVRVVQMDGLAVPTPLGEQLKVLAVDLTLRATIPMFYAPRDGEPDDGTAPDPGFPVVTQVTNSHDYPLGPPTGVSAEEWAEFLRATGLTVTDRAPQVVLLPVEARS